MKSIAVLESKALGVLSKKVCTYGELELQLRDPSINIKDLISRLKVKKKVKNISAGNRQIFFTKESQRLEADIKALGKYSLGIYEFLSRGGPKRTSEILQHLGLKQTGYLHRSMENLVSSGYVKYMKAYSQRDGDIYYIRATEEQLEIAKLSLSAQKVYRIIHGNKFPMHSTKLAELMGTNVFNAGNIAKRLVERGLVFESKPPGDENQEKSRRACFYANPSQEDLAMIMSISPRYGVKIYRALSKTPRETGYIVDKTGIPREQTFQVLARMSREGLVEKILGKPSKWYLAENAPKLYLRSYRGSA